MNGLSLGFKSLFLTTTNLGKLISSIEPKAQWHLDPNVFNCSQHILIRDQMTPCAASIWRPARVDINLILVKIFSPQKMHFTLGRKSYTKQQRWWAQARVRENTWWCWRDRRGELGWRSCRTASLLQRWRKIVNWNGIWRNCEGRMAWRKLTSDQQLRCSDLQQFASGSHPT